MTRRVATTQLVPQELLAAIVASSDDAITSQSLDGTVLSWNAAAERLYGYAADEMLGQPVERLYPPELRAEMVALLGRIKAGEQVDHLETVRVRKDGSRVAVSVAVSPVTDAAGRIMGTSTIGRSLEARRRAEQTEAALARSEAQYRALMEQAAEAIVVADASGHIVDANAAACYLIGYTREELLELEIVDTAPPAERARAEVEFAALAHGGRIVAERQLLRQDGSSIPVELSLKRLADGRVLGVARDLTERRRAEEALRTSEEKFSKVFFSAPVGIVVSRLSDGRLLDVNREFEQLFGYRRDEVIGRTAVELGLWGDPEARVRYARRVAAGEEIRDLELDMRARSGAPLILRSCAQSVELQGERLLLATFIDVSDRKRAEAALRHSEDKFEKVFTAAPASMTISRLADGEILEVNDEFTRLMGFERTEVVGRRALDLGLWHDPADRAEVVRLLSQHGSVRNLEFDVRAKGGRVLGVRYSAQFIALGGESLLLSAFVDITERRDAQEALRRSETYFRSLIAQALDIIIVVNPDGSVRYASPSTERTLGQRPGLLEGRPLLDLVHPDDVAAVRAGLFEGGGRDAGHPLEIRCRRADGAWRTLEVVAQNLALDPVVAGSVLTARDATDRRSLEAQLQQAQKMEAIGRLAGGVAHDFNNLLTAIIGYTELLLSDLPAGAGPAEDVAEIRKAANRAAGLTRQLLAFSRQQVLEPRVVDLNELTSNMERMLTRLLGEDVELRVKLDPALGTVRADPGQIEQVLMNLAVNARDAMPSGGMLTIETTNLRLDTTLAGALDFPTAPGPHVMLAVSDTGIGMDDETKSRIFEPFFTTKERGKGTGLGLSMVYGVVRQSGGVIRVYSEPGRGTTFRIYLPRVDEPAESLAAPDVAGAQSGSETILVVEDEPGVRGVAAQVLRRQGYRVFTAEGPVQALALLDQMGSELDLLLTDVVMPGGNGRDLATEVVARCPHLRVVFMSGYTDEAIVRHGILEPGIAYIQKPFTTHALAHKIRAALDEAGLS